MAGFSKADEQFRDYALSAPPLKALLSTCAPLALYQALNQIFKILDALLAARISSNAVSAVSCLSQITLMITALGSGLAVGGSIKISEAYGQGDYELMRKRVASVYAMAAAVSALAALTLIPFAVPFLRLLQTPEALIETGAGYFRIEILTLVITFFNTVYIAIERSRGHSRRILLLNLAVVTVKLGLSALFVYVLRGDLVLIAAASLAGQILLAAYALFSMGRDEGAFQFSVKHITWSREVTLPILNLAYPAAAEKMLFAAGKVIINSMSGVYGALTVGALGISNNIGGLTTGWHAGFQDGAAPLISQNRGAGKHRRTLQLYFWLLAINAAIGAAGILLVSSALPWLADVFALSKNSFDQGFRDQIVAIHQWEMLGYVTLGINSATLSLLLGYGKPQWTLFLNVSRVFVFRVPVLWFLQRFTHMGPEAAGVTMMVSNVCTGVAAAAVAIPMVLHIRRLCRDEEAKGAA